MEVMSYTDNSSEERSDTSLQIAQNFPIAEQLLHPTITLYPTLFQVCSLLLQLFLLSSNKHQQQQQPESLFHHCETEATVC